MLEIMKEYGWDYYTYREQPLWVINLIVKKLGIESKLASKAAEQPQTHA